MSAPSETFISIDVETAGPYPGRYSLLSIGACMVDDPQNGFYIELKPVNKDAVESALHATELSLDKLSKEGVEPIIAMPAFADWIRKVAPGGTRALMVGFNAPFACWVFADLDQAPEVAPGIFWNGGKSSVRRIRWYAAGNV